MPHPLRVKVCYGYTTHIGGLTSLFQSTVGKRCGSAAPYRTVAMVTIHAWYAHVHTVNYRYC